MPLPALDSKGNSRHRVLDYPLYGSGESGWRDQLVVAVNLRAEAGAEALDDGSPGFYDWLRERASSLPAGALLD